MEQPVTLRPREGSGYTILNAAGTAVGEISLTQSREEVTLRFSVLPEFRGRGYASAAVGQLTKQAHEAFALKNIHAYCAADNDMARHVLEHRGYERAAEEGGVLLYVHHLEQTLSDESYAPAPGQRVLYLAGGCFWGMEKAFRALHGVTETVVGYANGTLEHPSYEQVCRSETGYRECVRVTFDPAVVNTQTVLRAYFLCIDPTRSDGQGNDIGTQYLTGVYYRDPSLRDALERFFADERGKYRAFHVELAPLQNFWLAEEYHQDYLTKIPTGYCHISHAEIEAIEKLNQA